MSFSGGGVGGAMEALTYMIRAYDMATPVFRAFGAEVEATTKKVQASLAEMNRAEMRSSEAATKAAESQTAASKKAVAASEKQASAAKASAATTTRAAAESEAAFGRSSSALSRFGRDFLVAGAAVAGGSLLMATRFQANTLRMQTQAGATTKELAKIRQGLLDMAGQVGVTPNKLADGMYHIVSSMDKVLPAVGRVNQELKIMKIAAEGAQIGHSDLQETTYALASAMNALHLQAKSASQVMGELNAIVGSGDMTMTDLIQSFKSGIIPAAKEFGISLQSVGAALSVMGDMGMRGALAGTRLRMAISLLAAPTKQAAGILETLGMSSHQALATTDAMSKALAKAGISVTTLSNDLRKPDGLKVALEDLNHHLRSNGLSADAASAAIDRAFGGGRMGATIKLLAENTDRLGIKFHQIGQSAGQFGADWTKTSRTFRVEVDRAVASVEALGVKLGNDLLPYAEKGLHDLENMANWLSKNKQVLDALGIAVITFSTVAIGSYFFSKMKGAMGLMRDFGGSVGGMGRWMLGMNTAGSTAAATGGGGGVAGASGALLGGIWGITGTQRMVGTRLNPMGVMMIGAAGAGGVTSTAAGAEANATRGSSVATAASAEERQIARDLKAGGAALDARIAALQAETANPFRGSVGALPVRPAGAINNPVTGTVGEGLVGGSTRPASGRMTYPVGAAATAATTEAQLAASGGITMAALKGAASNLMGGLMRGGMIAGLGILGSQMVGHAIGGPAGSAVSSIGTGVSAGAGIGAVAGSVIPGLGTALGAGVGAGLGGAIAAAIHFLGTKDYGKSLADTLTVGFRTKATDNLKNDIAKSLDAAKEISDKVAVPHPIAFTRTGVGSNVSAPVPLTPEQIQKREADYQKAGRDLAKAVEMGWSKFKFQDVPTMFSQLNQDLAKMPPQVQAIAIQSAVAYAHGLEKNKKLPAGATKEMLDAMRVQYPGFEKYIGLSAQADVATFTKQFDFTQAEKNLSDTMAKMSMDFPTVKAAMDSTTGDAQDKSKAMIVALKAIVISGSGPMRKQALADIAALRSGATQDFLKLTDVAVTNTSQMAALIGKKYKNMHQAVATETKGMMQSVSSNSGQAFQIGTTNFTNLAKNIASAIGAGAEATNKGMQNITDQVNAALKGFGEKPMSSVTIKSLTPGQLAAVITGQVSAGAAESPHATGGKVASRTYMVGEEAGHPEYVLATNPAYRPRNVALWAQYAQEVGIPGFAKGGKANAARSTTGGVNLGGQYVFPFPKGEAFTWERVDQGQDLMGPPGGPVLAIAPGVVSRASDSFSGFGPFYPTEQITSGSLRGRGVYYGHTKISRTGVVNAGDVIASTQTQANQWTKAPAGWLELGFLPYGSMTAGHAIAPLLHALASGHMVAGAGGLSSIAPHLIAPKVKGLGAIGQVAQGALNRLTSGANAYIQAHVPTGVSGSGAPAGNLSGPVASQINQYFSRQGFSKIAIAGILGNWVQESGLNPNLTGASGLGLAQWMGARRTAAYALAARQHMAPTALGLQLQFADQELRGGFHNAFTAIQGARSPAEAALAFMNQYEIPAGHYANASNRVAAANAAFAQGYAKGGKPGYEDKLQAKFADVTKYLQGMWSVAAPYYGRSALSGMPPITYTKGNDALFVGVDSAGGPGHREFFLPDWIVEGKHGLANKDQAMLGLMLHEWTHEFQNNRAINKAQAKAPKNIIVAEGGAQAFEETYAPTILGRMGLNPNRSALIDPRGAPYYPYTHWVEKNLGDDWILNTQFGHKRGGRMKFAGGFADGGSFTAHGPTMGLFGEGGRIEDVYAIPRQTGGVLGLNPNTYSQHTHTGPKGTSHSSTHSTSTISGGTKTTTTTTTGVTATGKPTSSTTVTTSPVKPKATHYTTGFNPLTDQVESHTAAEWQKIHAEHAKQTHDAAAAKKKYDAYLAQQVQTTFTVGGQSVGAFDESRKLQQGQFGDVIKGGKVDILGDLNHLTVTAWKKLMSTIASGIGAMSLNQQMDMAAKLTGNVSKREGPLLHQEHGINSEINKLSKDADRRMAQAEKLHKEALTEHGRQRKEAIQVAHLDQITAKADRHHIANLTQRLNTIGDKIAGSRPAQEANIAIAAAAKGVTGQFTAQQSQFDKTTAIVGLLAAVRPGTSLKTLGLTPIMLKAAGLSAATAKSLIGHGTDTQAYASEIKSLTAKQIPEYQADAKRLQTLYNQALKTHNKKLQASLLTQLDAVTQATLKAYGDLQTAQVNLVESIFTKAQTNNAKLQGSADIAGAIAGLSPGTNLSAIGLGRYASLAGTEGNANPMATANFTNWMLGGQRGNDIAAMNQLRESLPSLSGPALDTANAHILDLSKSILDLTTQINQNLIKAIQATAQTFQNTSDLAKGGTDLLGQIENFKPGTDLGAMGLTPAVLSTLGLNSAQAVNLEGSGLNYLGVAQTAQGGVLTPAQMAAAKSGTDALNAGLKAQETPLTNELQYYQGQLPNLQGQGRTDAINAMLGLAGAIAGLEQGISDNNDALAKLTTATNANTTATGQMTGTVAYQYQGQGGYTASLSSERSLNLGVGG